MIFQTKKLFIVASSLIFVNCAPLRQKPENNSVVKQDTEPFVQQPPSPEACGGKVNGENFDDWIFGVGPVSGTEYGRNWYTLITPGQNPVQYYAKVINDSNASKIRQKIGTYYIDMKIVGSNINILADSYSKGLETIAGFKEITSGIVSFQNGSEWIKPATFLAPHYSSQVNWLYKTKIHNPASCGQGVEWNPPLVLTIFRGCVDSIYGLPDSDNKIVVIDTHETFLNGDAQTRRRYYARSYGLVKVSTADSFGQEGQELLNFGGNLNVDRDANGVIDNEFLHPKIDEYCSPSVLW